MLRALPAESAIGTPDSRVVFRRLERTTYRNSWNGACVGTGPEITNCDRGRSLWIPLVVAPSGAGNVALRLNDVVSARASGLRGQEASARFVQRAGA